MAIPYRQFDFVVPKLLILKAVNLDNISSAKTRLLELGHFRNERVGRRIYVLQLVRKWVYDGRFRGRRMGIRFALVTHNVC